MGEGMSYGGLPYSSIDCPVPDIGFNYFINL